jgi:prepilin-type processing-associated H-X9-DG protein
MNCYLGDSPLTPYTPGYIQFHKLTDIQGKGISSATAFLFIDESSDAINDAAFLVSMSGYDPQTPGSYSLFDFPATYHGDKSTVSFADGHVESKKWVDERTKAKPPTPGPCANNLDVGWLQDHATKKAN